MGGWVSQIHTGAVVKDVLSSYNRCWDGSLVGTLGRKGVIVSLGLAGCFQCLCE